MKDYKDALDVVVSCMGYYVDKYGNEIDLLQELVDKATPMEAIPKVRMDGIYIECPKCYLPYDGSTYCSRCGQRLIRPSNA